MSAVHAYRMALAGRSGVILCAREFMNSLEDSSMEEVKHAIAAVPWLASAFDVGQRYIRTKDDRVHYVFAGLRHSLDSIKSKARILLSWVDEAESVSEQAWRKLLPTVREADSEVWVTWNPEREDSPTTQRFMLNPPGNCLSAQLNYHDNPWFPKELDDLRRSDHERLDLATYAHIWEGEFLRNSNAQVLAGKVRVAEFEAGKDWTGPYFGLDYGFAQDPTAAVKCWLHDGTLYIEHEAGRVGLELDATADYVRQRLPRAESHAIRADSARPESTSYLKRSGLPHVTSVEKWPGSVEDGIAYLRGVREIVIHPRCHETIREARLYSYKVDRLSGDVLPQIVDAHNHYIDALRYALAPMIRKRTSPTAIFGTYR